MKKRSVTKLALNSQTIRTLANDELTHVVGGLEGCIDRSKVESGCTTVPVADSVILSPIEKKL